MHNVLHIKMANGNKYARKIKKADKRDKNRNTAKNNALRNMFHGFLKTKDSRKEIDQKGSSRQTKHNNGNDHENKMVPNNNTKDSRQQKLSTHHPYT